MANATRVTITFSKACNMRCPFCYAFFDGQSYLKISDYKNIIRRLMSLNVKTVNFGGGDPLLYDNIVEIVKYAKSCNMRTTLDTNTLAYNSTKHADLMAILDMISIPIDGVDAITHDRIRNYNGSYKRSLSFLSQICSFTQKPEIRINTVIVRENHKQLKEMAEMLSNYPIMYWHLYDFIPIGPGRLIDNGLYVNPGEYAQTIADLEQGDYPFKVEHKTIEERKDEHIYITGDGVVYSNSKKRGEDYILGRSILDCEGISIVDYLR